MCPSTVAQLDIESLMAEMQKRLDEPRPYGIPGHMMCRCSLVIKPVGKGDEHVPEDSNEPL